jgi:hypothetical protein
MVRIQENREKADKWQGAICPNIFKKMKINIVRSGKCYVLWMGKMALRCRRKKIGDTQSIWSRKLVLVDTGNFQACLVVML